MKNSFQSSLFITDHKESYKEIRNYLAGRFVGATRDRALLDEVVKCLYSKAYLNGTPSQSKHYDSVELSEVYKLTFSKLKQELPVVFDEKDEILLDPESIAFIDYRLSNINLRNPNRDYFGDLYEVFVGTGIREEEGQFFTPKNGTELLVSMIDPQKEDKILDLACGAGGFLDSVAKHLIKQGCSSEEVAQNVFGIDKDCYLVKLASTRLSLLTRMPSQIYCADSLSWTSANNELLILNENKAFDIILTNPPFGKRIVAVSKEIQKTFELGYKWRWDKQRKIFEKTNTLLKSVPPQVLFLEKMFKIIKTRWEIRNSYT